MQIASLLFSKKFLNFDFLSNCEHSSIIEISFKFFSIISSIVFKILSETLVIIISFLSSKKDLVSKLSLKFSGFCKISLSS